MSVRAKSGLNLLPLDFLEAYPFPAFALRVPIPLESKSENLYAAINLGVQSPSEYSLSSPQTETKSEIRKVGAHKHGSNEPETGLLGDSDAFGTNQVLPHEPTLVGPSDGTTDPASLQRQGQDKEELADEDAPIAPQSTFAYNPFLRAGYDFNAETLSPNQSRRVQLSDIPFTRSHGFMSSALNPVWGNGKWRAVMKGRELLECIGVAEARQLGNWVTGLTEWEIRKLATAERRRGRQEARNKDRSSAAVQGRPDVKSPPVTRARSAESAGSGSSGSSGLDMSQSKTWQRRRERRKASGSPGHDWEQSASGAADRSRAGRNTPPSGSHRPSSGSGKAERDSDEENGTGMCRVLELIASRESVSVFTSVPADTLFGLKDEEPDSEFLDELLEQPTLTIHLKDPGISLELIKTAFPMDPPDMSLSYLVIQAIARRLPASEPEESHHHDAIKDSRSRVAHKDQQDEQEPTAEESAPSSPTTSITTTSIMSKSSRAWPFDRSSTIVPGRPRDDNHDADPSSTQLTPVAERDVAPFTPSVNMSKSQPRRKARNHIQEAAIAEMFPSREPMIVGNVDKDQFTGPRKSPDDPRSIEYCLRNIDWDRHVLGPIDRWPQSLKTAFSLILSFPGQAMLWWGSTELCLLYNDHYARMTGKKHPELFGKAGAVGYAEVWSALGPLAEQVLAGTALAKDDDPFLFETMEEKMPLRELFHSWVWSPVRDESGATGGLFNYTRETTKKVLAERRLKCVRETNDLLSASRNIKEFNQAVTEGFSDEAIAKDLPFSLIYHVKQEDTADAEHPHNLMDDRSIASTKRVAVRLNLTRGGMVGIPEGHASAPAQISLTIHRQPRSWGALDPQRVSSPTMSMISALSAPQEDQEVRIGDLDHWPLADALESRKSIVVEEISDLIAGYEVRSWGILPTSAIVVPVFNESSSETPALVVILGLNPRRPYDLDYSEWILQLRLQLYNGLLQVRSVEAESRRLREVEEMDAIKTSWIASVSHELRLPLTLIGGPMDDIIGEMKEGSRQRNALIMARRNVNRLQRLIDQLMDFSRLEAGKLSGCFRPVAIGLYTRELATLFRSAIEKARLRYTVDCESDEGRVCYVDADLYEKIVLNMIGNAYKYTHWGSIEVALHYTEFSVVLTVTDTGVGIPYALLDRVTERFFRVPSSARSHEGSGIGLSLTKELIRLHGGTLEVSSVSEAEAKSQSHGSTFTVTLPLGFTHLPAVEEEADTDSRTGKYAKGVLEEVEQWNREDAASAIGTESESGLSSNPLTSSSGGSLDPSTLFFTKEDVILIVDDSRDMRTYLASIFSPYVGRVLQAGDGLQGLEMAKVHRPQLIVSDVQMPTMDGFQLLQALKTMEDDLRFTPIILLTARAGEGDRVFGLTTGADDYLVKPFNSKELIARASLQVQLGKRRRVLEEAFVTRLDEVERRREEAESERRRQELLIDVTSHELRNPTSAIIQASSMVLRDLGDLRAAMEASRQNGTVFAVTDDLLTELSADEDLCQNIFNCANTQNTISSDILTLATISLDKLTFSEAPTNMEAKIREVCGMFALEAKSKQIELAVTLSENMAEVPLLVTDPARLGQVLVNLTANSLKFTADRPIRRVSFHVSLAATPPYDSSCAVPTNAPLSRNIRDGDTIYLYISVTDTGPGLPQEELEKLFQRFSQAKQTGPNRVWGGSGLGLYVSRKIAEQMGGRIEVVSVVGEGATFRFFIRVKAAGFASAPRSTAVGAAIPPVTRRKSSMDRERAAHVLVVEDNLINQKLILRQLRKAGLTCEAASNGLEAVQRVRQVCSTSNPIDKPFDTILLDLEMPVMGGLEAIKIIRSEEQQGLLTRSTVYALTGNARQGQIDEAKAHGMDEVIIKPYRLDDVLDMIADAVAENQPAAPATSAAMRRNSQPLSMTEVQ